MLSCGACRICLVASCPGGTASNVVTFLANADVALSVMMTTVSTLAAVVMTPLLTKTLVGAMVPVDAKALFLSTLQVDNHSCAPYVSTFRVGNNTYLCAPHPWLCSALHYIRCWHQHALHCTLCTCHSMECDKCMVSATVVKHRLLHTCCNMEAFVPESP